MAEWPVTSELVRKLQEAQYRFTRSTLLMLAAYVGSALLLLPLLDGTMGWAVYVLISLVWAVSCARFWLRYVRAVRKYDYGRPDWKPEVKDG